MPHPMKIATCCYCGTRAALVLDRVRHELACGSCGAPLHNMKMMPKPAKPAVRPAPTARYNPAKPLKRRKYDADERRPKREKKKSRRRWGREMLEDMWDVIEDIFD